MSDIVYGRLVMRPAGDFWNAYYAKLETMDGALFLGSIRLSLVAENIDNAKKFTELMQGIVGSMIREVSGEEPVWNVENQS